MKNTVIAIMLGFLISIIGSFILVYEIMNIEYLDESPKNLIITEKEYTYKLDRPMFISPSYEIVIDNNIKENEVKVVVKYYNEYFNLYESKNDYFDKIELDYYTELKVNGPAKMFKLMLGDLKDNKFYNYSFIKDTKVTIYVNEKSYSDIKKTEANNFFLRDETIICPQALEEIARDDENIYYLNCMKSGTVFLIFNDGTKISLRNALTNNQTTIEELIEKGLEVYIEEISF